MAEPKTIEWQLDTCGCKLFIEWANATALDERDYTYRIKERCPLHMTSPVLGIVEDNRAKNNAIREVALVSGNKPDELSWERGPGNNGRDYIIRKGRAPNRDAETP